MPQPPQDFIEDAETDEEIHAECLERFRIAEEVEAQDRLLAIEDLEFADGQQWPDDIYNLRKIQRRPTLTINHTATIVRRVVNNMKEQRPRIKTHPVSDATIDDARVANGLIRHVETLSKASVAYDTAGESAIRIGWGYFRIVGDYVDEKSFDQELFIKPVRNAMTGYIDPSAQLPDGSDMQWFIFSTKMKKTEFKRKYAKENLNDFTQAAPGDGQNQWETKEEIRLAEYYRVKNTQDTLYKLSNMDTVFSSEYRKNKEAYALAGITIVKQRTSNRRQIQWFRISGTKVIEKRDLPGRWIPVVRVEGDVTDINGDVRRKGMIRDLKQPAINKNYWVTAKAEKLALSSKAPWVMAEGQADGHPEWDDANQKPYSVLKYKLITGLDGQPLPGVQPPQRQGPVEVEAGFAEASQGAERDLMAVAGMPHEPNQDTPGTVVSGIALRRRQAISDISHFQFYDNQTMSIAHCGVILLDLFPYYYGEERMQRIIGDDGVPSMIGLNKPKTNPSTGVSEIAHNMNVGRYDVVMDTGPGYETKRQEGAEAMIDLLKTPLGEPVAKTGADLIVRNMDFPGASDLADRLMPISPQGMSKAMENLPHEAKGIVTALQTQLQHTQQQLQQAQMELKYKMTIEQGWQKTEIQKAHLAATGKAHDVEMRDRTAERDTQVKVHGQLAVAEIGAAGQLLNTNTEAAHSRAAAQEMVKAGEAAEKSNGKSS
jgi:hypothetical protein